MSGCGGVDSARWWRGSRALRTGFDRLRANGEGSKRACDVGWWGRAAARRTSGYRLSPVRRWRVWEVGEAETPPRRAPALDSRFTRERRVGVAGKSIYGSRLRCVPSRPGRLSRQIAAPRSGSPAIDGGSGAEAQRRTRATSPACNQQAHARDGGVPGWGDVRGVSARGGLEVAAVSPRDDGRGGCGNRFRRGGSRTTPPLPAPGPCGRGRQPAFAQGQRPRPAGATFGHWEGDLGALRRVQRHSRLVLRPSPAREPTSRRHHRPPAGPPPPGVAPDHHLRQRHGSPATTASCPGHPDLLLRYDGGRGGGGERHRPRGARCPVGLLSPFTPASVQQYGHSAPHASETLERCCTWNVNHLPARWGVATPGGGAAPFGSEPSGASTGSGRMESRRSPRVPLWVRAQYRSGRAFRVNDWRRRRPRTAAPALGSRFRGNDDGRSAGRRWWGARRRGLRRRPCLWRCRL